MTEFFFTAGMIVGIIVILAGVFASLKDW